MIRSKLGLLGLCAVVLGVVTMSAGSAQGALSWLVLDGSGANPKELKALLIAESDSADLTLLFKLLGKKFALTCTNLEFGGVNLEAGGKLTEGGKNVYTGCEAYGKGTLEEPLGCKVHSAGSAAGRLETAELKGGLTGGGSEVLLKIEPKTAGNPFATFLTEECVIPESNSLRGVIYLKDCEALKDKEGKELPCDQNTLVHAVRHLVESAPLTSLYVGTDNAEHLETSIDGSAWVKLGGAHNGLKWSAMDA
jgi:hypothetical protein